MDWPELYACDEDVMTPILRTSASWLVALAISYPSAAAVTIAGVEGEVLENVQQFVANEPDCDANAALVRAYADELEIDLLPALEAFGYYRAEIADGGRRADRPIVGTYASRSLQARR